MRRASPLVLTVLACGALAGCDDGGGDGGGGTATAPAAPAATGPAPPMPRAQLPKAFQVPSGVPARSAGRPADAVSRRVIRKWLGALRDGDIARAARFFAVPAKVQNGTRVLRLASPQARVIFNAAFPCGARATRIEGAAGGFTIVDFVLTERVGGDCGGGTGGRARSAIRVADGHIAEWYRLDEPPGPGRRPSPAPPSPPSPLPGTQIA